MLANLTVNVAGRGATAGVMHRSRLKAIAEQAVAEFKVRLASLDVLARQLSGGNQQKLLVARALSIRPALLMLDEPTRGVDIGAKSEIYRLADECAQRGMAVLLISSELPEIIALCDRVFVMREGRTTGVLERTSGPIIQEAIIALATGAAKES